MGYIPRHTQSIEIEFINKRNRLVCFRATLPYNNIKYNISSWYKRMQQAVSSGENAPTYMVTAKHKLIQGKVFDRILFEWPGGISLDMPAECTEYDYKIILAQLDVIKMSLK